MSFYGSQQGFIHNLINDYFGIGRVTLGGNRSEKCLNFEKCCCLDLDCGFIHMYKYCFNYQNTTCKKKNCQFLHCTSVEQHRYSITGKATENLKREVGRTLQNTNICGDFKKTLCTRTKCKRLHVKDNTQPLECPICREQFINKSFGAGICGHIFCYNCALRCLSNDNNEELITVICPICRSQNVYKKLM